MAYRDMTASERAERGRRLADALESKESEERDQEQVKKAMRARINSLTSEIAKLKTEVRTGKEWVGEQGTLELGTEVEAG
jgi:phage shock protein A